jgi:L-asparaginase
MKFDPETGALKPFNFVHIEQEVPELKKFAYTIEAVSLPQPIDSSEIQPQHWQQIAEIIFDTYDKYDGFVVLHGTDTMAYTASALSFMLENLGKTVVLTGSQLPIGVIRTDGKENLISAIEIAASGRVPEVCIFFKNELLRGNRTSKCNVEHFHAFSSDNYPPLAQAGVHIAYNEGFILPLTSKPLRLHKQLDTNVAILRIFPGMTQAYVESILRIKGLRAVVLQTYGSGNAPTLPWFLALLRNAVNKGIVVLNISQCNTGMVKMTTYDAGRKLMETGVISGYDSTMEAALTKLMYLLGQCNNADDVKKLLAVSLRGERAKLVEN